MNLESLLISRDAALLGVLRPTLEKLSVNVEVCAGSETGSEMLGKRKFDAVIVDCDDMQGGIGILTDLRKTHSNASSVAFAVLNGNTTTQEAFRLGANFVLQKPLTPLNATRCFNAALNFMLRERRRYFRHPVEMPVRISIPDGVELNATATDLSEGGMAICITGKLPREVVANLKFTLPGSHTSLELRGNIAWANTSGKAGVRFVDVPQSSQYQLEKWLTDRIQAELPSLLKPHLQSD
ncbi:MAG TPA: PilZ domain-containing protein [Terriglobales bacterium]|nr:PilZ domain-containing protein [Terriglobales bacterium]